MLKTKKCTNCNTCILTFAQTPYCRRCIKNVCCMSKEPNCDGNYTCNCTFDVSSFGDRDYCLGHFKVLQNQCATCGVCRPQHCVDFQENYMWYCPKHLIQHKKDYINRTYSAIRNILCVDLIIEILKIAMKPVVYRYPDTFNIPLHARKPLKQQDIYEVKSNVFSGICTQ